jgi:hypothetical protein
MISRAQGEAPAGSHAPKARRPRDLSFTLHHLTPHASATIDDTEAKGSKG